MDKRKISTIVFVVLLFSARLIADFFHMEQQIFLAIIAAVFGIYLFFQGFAFLNRKRLIQNIPTSKINALALGLVEVIGRTLPSTPKPFKSPYAKANCVFYHYRVQQFVRRQRNSGWKTISEGSSGVPFYVDDGTGKVLVNPNEAEIHLETRYVSSSPDGKGSVISPWMASTGGSGAMRYIEEYIMPNENVYVLGTAKKSRDYVAEHQGEVEKTISNWTKDKEKVKEFDTTGDGWLDDVEFFQMRQKVEAEVSKEEGREDTKRDLTGLADIIIGKGEEKGLIISDKSEREITSALKAKTFLLIFGGAALTLAMVIYLLAKL